MTCHHSHDAIRNGLTETVLCTRETSDEATLCDVHGRPCACGNSIPVESDESLCEDCDAAKATKQPNSGGGEMVPVVPGVVAGRRGILPAVEGGLSGHEMSGVPEGSGPGEARQEGSAATLRITKVAGSDGWAAHIIVDGNECEGVALVSQNYPEGELMTATWVAENGTIKVSLWCSTLSDGFVATIRASIPGIVIT